MNTGTDQFRLRNITLGAAQPSTATTSWTRFEYTFTTTTGGVYELSIQNTENAAANIEFFGAMLNVGSSANDYVKVDPSTGGSAPTPAYSGFGDVFGGATAYYSLRKFTEAETLNAIRVRRSSDDTEQDIGFDSSGDLDTTALLAFVGTGGTDNGYVTTWYDQTGNGNDATNATESEQPLIVSGGTLVEENGKAALDFDGVDDTLLSAASFAQPYTAFAVRKFDTNSGDMLISHDTSTFFGVEFRFVAITRLSNGTYLNHSVSPTTTQGLLYALGNGSNSEISIDGGITTTGNSGTAGVSELSIGGRASYYFNGKIQEAIYFNSDQSANRGTVTTGGGTLIEGNINTYFDIV